MADAKFTKGPWYLDISLDIGSLPIVTDLNWGKGHWVAQAMGPHVSPAKTMEEIEANGKLISMALDMFEFITTLENDNNSIPDWLWQKRNEIIKKITE